MAAPSRPRTNRRVVYETLRRKVLTLELPPGTALSENELALYGSWCFKITDWPRVIRLVSRGKYPVTKALSSVIDLPDVVSSGFDALVDPQGSDMKILVRP